MSRARAERPQRGYRVPVLLAIGLALVLAAGLGGWALRATLVGAGSNSDRPSDQEVWASARTTSIGSSLNLSTTVKQEVRPVASNHLTGVVSAVSAGQVKAGASLYAVAGRDVYAAQGAVPFYEDLTPASSGETVRQLEAFLSSLGHFRGSPDARFDDATTAAVKAWQKATGQKQEGTVALGQLVAVPRLPGTVQLGEGITLGKQLAGGEDAVLAATGEREFSMSLTAAQAAMIPQDSVIKVSQGKSTWTAVIASSTSDDSGAVTLSLASPSGGPVCGDECSSLPSGTRITLRSQVVVVPATKGVGVPVASIVSTPDGSTHVRGEQGEKAVKVLASGQGMAIVDGLAEGERVLVLGPVPGTSPGTTPPTSASPSPTAAP